MISYEDFLKVYRNKLKNREYGKEAPRFSPKLAGAERLGAPINASFMGFAVAVKLENLTPGSPKTHRLWGGVQAGRKAVAARRCQKPILQVVSV